MKSVKTNTKINLLSVRVLLLIYVLICVLTILFSNTFINDILVNSKITPLLQMFLYFTIPAVLLVFLAIYVFSFADDILQKKPGSKFQTRLILNFSIIVILTATPVILVTIQTVTQVTYFWREVRIKDVLSDARKLAVDVYTLGTKNFEEALSKTDIDDLIAAHSIPDSVTHIQSVQDFTLESGGTFLTQDFIGASALKLPIPPSLNQGFAIRELPRDTDLVRYIDTKNHQIIRVITFALDAGFDTTMQLIDSESARFELLNNLFSSNKNKFLFFYILVFLLPTILITMIIAINFTRDVTKPIVELSEATMQVAKGDFTIQILNSPKNEFGMLVNNFNKMVQNLETTQNALVRTEKISIWQKMAQQLAHEIKNPLTPIKLTAERVLRRYQNEPEKALEILENSMLGIIQEVDSLSTLLEEFKTLSRPMEPSQSKTNVKEAIEEIIKPYLTSYPNVVFDTANMYSSVNVRIDRKHLTQVLNNLIINAIDAMDKEGKIDIRTDLVNKRQSKYCRLIIQDTGKGIEKEDIDKVWTPYFTTKDSGTGLGLPIVERIITDHGGGIWFNSAQGEGTTFFVDLPVDE
ncbi:MAG: HAMP domain-containing protein [Spirochaetaceae bacterium]|jgi:nitrogen fixation/metabolism regulation signal transduction histidine kinase|nr:HAMP domain-containing protein [Spirochaetaceae bacterium]